MEKLIRLNKWLGWILIFGFIVMQSLIFYSLDPHVKLAALLPLGIFTPLFIISCLSVLNRTRYQKQIKSGLRIGILLIVGIPILFPLLFDFEFIYISFIGITLGIIVWRFRKSTEIQLFIINSISFLLLISLTLLALFGT